jgi:hypothetical protein
MSETYEFLSSGGCERCDAMEGLYDYEPTRPHPNCRCAITPVNEGRGYTFIHETMRMEVDFHPDHPGDYDHLYVTEVEVQITLTCEDGRTFADTLTIDTGPDDEVSVVVASAVASYASFMNQSYCIGIS